MYRTVLTLLSVCAVVIALVVGVNVLHLGSTGFLGASGASSHSSDGCGAGWVSAWNASPMLASGRAVVGRPEVGGRSLRMIVRPRVAGSDLRLVFSNRYSDVPLDLRSVSVGYSDGGPALVGRPMPVTFDRLDSGQIPPHGLLVSDPVSLTVESDSTLAVNLFVPGRVDAISEHPWAMTTSFLSDQGDYAGDAGGDKYTHATNTWLILTGVDVMTPTVTSAVVMMGDSITDGMGSSLDADRRLSDDVGNRLAALGGNRAMAVLNAGIAGNQLLTDKVGESTLKRLGWEVIGRPGVTDVILHIGTNDLAAGASPDEVIAGLVEFTEQAHRAGLRVFLTTVTPATNGPHRLQRTVEARNQLNQWLRAHGREHADGVFDFAAAVTDVSNPNRLTHGFDAGDGIHLSDVGYRALAGAVDLSALSGNRCGSQVAGWAPVRSAAAGTGTDG